MIKAFVKTIRYRSRLRKFRQFMDILKPTPSDRILEVGIANREYSEVDNFLIKYYPCPEQITALGFGDISEFKRNYPQVQAVSYNGGQFPFKDKEFDIVHSNAVIEHVGPFEEQVFFLKELVRIAKRGMSTTPNRKFIIETHTNVPLLHWLDKKTFDSFLKMTGKEWASGNYMYLLSYNELEKLLKEANLYSYQILRNKLFGMTMTFSIIWWSEK